jgi:hypothetical protein
VTVTVAVPFPPSAAVAVMVAEPAALPVTTPVVETVATVVLLLVHVTARPVGLVVALSVTVALTAMLAVAGEMVTVVRGAAAVVKVPVAELGPDPALLVAVTCHA